VFTPSNYTAGAVTSLPDASLARRAPVAAFPLPTTMVATFVAPVLIFRSRVVEIPVSRGLCRRVIRHCVRWKLVGMYCARSCAPCPLERFAKISRLHGMGTSESMPVGARNRRSYALALNKLHGIVACDRTTRKLNTQTRTINSSTPNRDINPSAAQIHGYMSLYYTLDNASLPGIVFQMNAFHFNSQSE